MEEFVDRRCDKLSMGQKQKVSIARTIVHDPPVLILDEPTRPRRLAARAIMDLIRDCRARARRSSRARLRPVARASWGSGRSRASAPRADPDGDRLRIDAREARLRAHGSRG